MNFDKILTPELKNTIDNFSDKMKKEMQKDADPKKDQNKETEDEPQGGETQGQPSYGQNIGNLLNAFQNVLKEDPRIIDRTVDTIRGGVFQQDENGENGGMANMMGMLGSLMGGGGMPMPGVGDPTAAAASGPTFQLTDAAMDDYEEKQVILPCTQEEINNEVEKKFRLRLHPDEPNRKTTYKLKLEKDTYIYTFWYFNEEEGKKNTFVRVAVQLPDSEVIKE